MRIEFSGKNVVVTGGTGALGRAVVERLLAAGALCHVPCFNAAELEGCSFRDSPQVRIVPEVDLREEASAEAFYSGLPSLWASIHCAGGFAMEAFTATRLRDFEALHSLNTGSCFLCCREAVKKIRAGGEGGRIVNVAARPALEPRSGAGMVAYTCSKAAVAALTESLGEELAGEEIWVNAVAPSILDTPANRKAMPQADPSRWVSPEAVAEAIVFLASPQNRCVRSAVVEVYGQS